MWHFEGREIKMVTQIRDGEKEIREKKLKEQQD
jgi:hypothetical protein